MQKHKSRKPVKTDDIRDAQSASNNKTYGNMYLDELGAYDDDGRRTSSKRPVGELL